MSAEVSSRFLSRPSRVAQPEFPAALAVGVIVQAGEEAPAILNILLRLLQPVDRLGRKLFVTRAEVDPQFRAFVVFPS